MAITYKFGRLVADSHLDVKPSANIPDDTELLEVNTRLLWVCKSNKWYPADYHSHHFGRVGTQTATGTQGEGLLSNETTSQGTRNIAFVSGKKIDRWQTSATPNTVAGPKSATVNETERAMNPRMYIHIRLNRPSTSEQCFIGYSSSQSTSLNGDDYLNALSGFGVGFRTTDTTWQIVSNDGSGATVFTQVTGAISLAAATDYIFEIRADETNTKWQVAYNGGSFQDISSDIPAFTTVLCHHMEIRNTDSVDHYLELFHRFIGDLSSIA